MTEERLVSLMANKLFGALGPAEVQELEEWGSESVDNSGLLKFYGDAELVEMQVHGYAQIDPGRGYDRWLEHRTALKRARNIRITGWSAAASLLVVLAIGGLMERPAKTGKPMAAEVQGNRPGDPGRNTAMLTLADGQAILLDTARPGEVARQGNARVMKADSGRITYMASKQRDTLLTYNTLTTPRSGDYQVTLADGSKVWLNNVSKLHYPTAFGATERRVELEGEAYFEVTKDVTRPFVVNVKDETVQVLGTSFNVMAYPEEGGTQTTLLDGHLRIMTAKDSVELRPGEQSRVETGGKLNVLKDVPGEDIVSWRDGYFYFDHASLDEVLRQLSRWYDVKVEYHGQAPRKEFHGKIDRRATLNDLLTYFDKNQVHLRLDGRKLIVTSE